MMALLIAFVSLSVALFYSMFHKALEDFFYEGLHLKMCAVELDLWERVN